MKRWQDALGVAETGRLEPGAVVVASGRLRVAEHRKRVGDRAGGEVLGCTGTDRVVTVDLDVRDRRLVRTGAEVEVVLPSGDTVRGEIGGIGRVAEENEGDAPATIEVTVALGDAEAADDVYDRAPVEVRLVAERRADVLAVPVGALLAQAGGGYAVQVVEDGAVRTVPVRTGAFTEGLVEVSGKGLAAGMDVGVPS
ncbi:hypothetical protein [Actinomadura sp. WMMB 499]|uniref:hypothetical protein n=1 Tax=Actinomadura sp. WMMB 499 TaxID=1219491 RepID=UPI0020C77C87|nr:hypothetical protein [Actinomadura sp. WMMB 499]